MVSGYFGGYSGIGNDDRFSLDQVNQLYSQTGERPGILGCDYAHGWDGASNPPDVIDSGCNSGLIDWSNDGGLVTINMHLPSPEHGGGGRLNDHMYIFGTLLDPTSGPGARWRAQLDKIAQALQELETAGVPVLFRPFHEMNGDWFWWGDQVPATFQLVWQDMFNYLTTTKGLDNLLWVYSPDASRGNRTAFYPGDGYVDIVGTDAYHSYAGPGTSVVDAAYNELSGLGKPFAFTEVGTHNGAGSFDFTQWSNAVAQQYPEATYVFSWNSHYGLVQNNGASAFMNADVMINRGEIDLSDQTEPGGGGTTTTAPTTTTTPPAGGTTQLAGSRPVMLVGRAIR